MPGSVLRPRRRQAEPAPSADNPVTSARAAGLRYATDMAPGITRRRTGRGFCYRDPAGSLIRDEATLLRIRSLAIPPAWQKVWICPSPNGHIQATGRDDKGRNQYRYHPRWTALRDETKYERLIAFGKALPRIRARAERDLSLPGLPREKVLATVVRLLEKTLVRVGNEEYARQNGSYGLTTLRKRHVQVGASTLRFRFRGKGGATHEVGVNDHHVARVVRHCQELPGQELFRYVDESGERRGVESSDVNEYLRDVSGQELSAKDFRTWSGTVLAAWALKELDASDPDAPADKNILRAVERVAAKLGNTRAVCRQCYIHPAVIDSYLDGSLVEALQQRLEAEVDESDDSLEPREAAVLALLEERLARESANAARSA